MNKIDSYSLAKDLEPKEALEQFIDQHGLGRLIVLLSQICDDKAEHLRSNWQDEAMGKSWDKAARKLDKVQPELDRLV